MNKKRFTLIELLIVIAIIGVLSSLVFVAYRPVRESVKKTVAKQECVSIEAALLSYYNDFYAWPASEGTLAGTMLNRLMGENDRDRYYLEANKKFTESNGTNYYDPWDREYNVVFADAQNNYFTIGGVNVYKKCGVWSYGGPAGADGGNLYDSYNDGRAIRSWR